MRAAAVLALLWIAAALPASALPQEKEKDDWIRLQTENFTFFSNASERSTRRIAVSLERLRSVLGQLNPTLQRASPNPIFIYVFRNDASLTPYKPLRDGKRIDVAGVFLSRSEADYVAVNGQMDFNTEGILYHEYLHYLLRYNYSKIPIWFNEGLAEFYSTFKTNDQYAEIGHASPEHIRWLRENSLIPLSELFAMDTKSKDYNEGYRRGVFYSESWALVHYLLLGNEGRRAQAIQYFQAITHGVDGKEAFRRAFNTDEATLEKELRDYVHRSLFNFARSPVAPEAKLQVTVQPMAWPETLTRLGDLLISQDATQAAAAAEHFRAALAVKPDYGPALAGLGLVAEAAGRPLEAHQYFAKAALLTPDDFFLQYRDGIYLSAQRTDPEALKKARAAFTRAVALRPGDGKAWAWLADTFSAERPLPPEALPAYENAHRLLPGDVAAAHNLMLAYARLGQRDRAAELIEKEIAPSATPREVQSAWEVWVSEGAGEAERLIGEQKLDAAAAILEELRRRAPAPLAGQVAARLAEVRRVSDHNRFAARYNQAVALLQEKKTDEAQALLADLAAGTPDPEMAESARKLGEQVAAMQKAQKASKAPAKKKKR